MTDRAPSEVIRRRKLHEEVAARVEALIASDDYSVGDQLPSERELMERYGVGRPAVREALLLLAKSGLLTLSSGERARIAQPTAQLLFGQLVSPVRYLLSVPESVRHFQQARLFFETGLARHAAEHASERQIAGLKEALDENHRRIGDLEAFNRTDVGFHYVLAKIPGNPIFTALHEAMVDWLTEQRTISLRNVGADQGAFDEHAMIFRAVEARDPDGAETAMREHLRSVAALYWRQRDLQTEHKET